ncbi:MAG TPA: glycoside hydrolase family 2 TIM barrel-domain containing protein [Lacunisphaera sp.]
MAISRRIIPGAASPASRRAPAVLLFTLLVALMGGRLPAERVIENIDHDWRFLPGDAAGAEQPDFADAGWRRLDVPHDWAFEAPYTEQAAQSDRGGYKPGGIGWYRREFTVDPAQAGRQWRVEFDAIYMNSEVWLNGHQLGRRPYGYISFGYDLTPHLKPGRNVLAVRVDNSREPSTRWYHGCGIYGHVRLVSTGAVRFAPGGIFVHSLAITAAAATVVVETELQRLAGEAGAAELHTRLLAPDGAVVAEATAEVSLSDTAAVHKQQFTVTSPQRWDLDTPRLYAAVSEVRVVGQVTDRLNTRFGLRELRWDTATGFWLNGRNLKLQGVGEHLEGGPVGAAWPDDLIRWKIKLLRDMGANAIRTAHNPQLPRFYELCDELGILVLDEVFDGWRQKAPEDYANQVFAQWWDRDLRDWLRRDRNHPSVFLYSLGNETSGEVAASILRVAREVDPTRAYTSGHAAPALMDVYGMNGGSESPRFFRNPPPAKPFLATEAPHTWQVRGFYRTKSWFRDGTQGTGNREPFPLADLTPEEIFTDDWIAPAKKANRSQVFNSSYDNAMARITARKNWELARDLPWFSGQFRWCGFDYTGEAGFGHGGWPFRAFMGGVIDLAGFPKDTYYFYQSQWTTAPMLHLLPHWTHPRMAPGTTIPVWAYTNVDEVELFLNGRSLGRDRPGRKAEEMQGEWLVPWEPGLIEAVGYREGREVVRASQRTAAAPAGLRLGVESDGFTADGQATARLTVAQVDAAGTVYPYGENRIAFHVEGPARLLSLENGNPVDTEPNYGVNTRRTFYGLARAFLQATREPGDVAVVVGAINGERRQLTSDRVTIDVQRIAVRGAGKPAGRFTIHYTTDGSRPGAASPRYAGAFPVALGTTVRALVLEDGREIMELEESFAADAGLHWLAPGEPREAPEAGLQAENAVLKEGTVRRRYLDYRGSGYVEIREGGSVEWYQENDGGRGQYRLRFRYTRGPETTAAASEVLVNDAKVGELPGPGGEVGDWQTYELTAALTGGANRIRIVAAPGNRVLLDEVQVENQPAAGSRERR